MIIPDHTGAHTMSLCPWGSVRMGMAFFLVGRLLYIALHSHSIEGQLRIESLTNTLRITGETSAI